METRRPNLMVQDRHQLDHHKERLGSHGHRGRAHHPQSNAEHLPRPCSWRLTTAVPTLLVLPASGTPPGRDTNDHHLASCYAAHAAGRFRTQGSQRRGRFPSVDGPQRSRRRRHRVRTIPSHSEQYGPIRTHTNRHRSLAARYLIVLTFSVNTGFRHSIIGRGTSDD